MLGRTRAKTVAGPRRRIIVAALLSLIVCLGAARLTREVRPVSAGSLAGFTATIAEDVAPVRDAPLTLTFVRIGPDGRPDPDFDWAGEDVTLEGLARIDGTPVTRIALAADADARQTSMTVMDGTLHAKRVVLTGPVVVHHAGSSTTVIANTIFGLAALLAPLVAIVLAVLSRQVILSLLLGIWVGCWAATGGIWGGFELLATELLPGSLSGNNAKIVIFSTMLGGVVALIGRMGGTQGLVEAVSRRSDSRRGAQLTTWVTGLFVFFDDYANALLVGNSMRPITDRFRVSREKLSYLVDATSAPVACVFVISTWIAAEVGYISARLADPDVQAATGLGAQDAYQTFIATIPYNFYPLLTLVFGLAICLFQRDFGPMLKAERRAFHEGKVLGDTAVPLTSREMDELEPVDPTRLRWLNAVIPIGVVIIGVIGGLYLTGRASFEDLAQAARDDIARLEWAAAAAPDTAESSQLIVKDPVSGTTTTTIASRDPIAAALAEKRDELVDLESPGLHDVFGAADSYYALMIAAMSGVLVAILLALSQRLLRLGPAVEVATAGMKSMMPALMVLILAWTLQAVCGRLNTSQWLVHHISFSLSYLPAVIFVLSAVMGFATGTSWGTMGLLVPLTIDYAVGLATGDGLGPESTRQAMIASVGAVLAGAVFGDHCSPISDTTIMSSMASGADHIDHVRTQLPYALVVAGVALVVGYLPAGFGVSPWVLLPVGAAACVFLVRVLGRRVDS